MKKLYFITASFFLTSPLVAVADTDRPGVIDTSDNVISAFENVANWMFTFLLIVVVIMILVTAFKFLNAEAGPEKRREAKMMLIYIAVAVVLALFAAKLPVALEDLLEGNLN